MRQIGFTRWIFIVSALFPPLLQLWPVASEFAIWRPLFPVVFIAFWSYVQPNVIGGVIGFIYGLIVELMVGASTGLYAIPCGLMSVAISSHYLKFRTFRPTHQAVLVFVCCVVIFFISYSLAYWRFTMSFWWLPFPAALSTAVCWLLCRKLLADTVLRTIKLHHV